HGVRLNQLVTVRPDYSAVEVNHVSLYRTFDVLVNTEKRAVGGVAADIQKVLAAVRPEVAQEIDKLEKHRDALLQMKSASKRELRRAERELNGLKSLRWELRGEYERMNQSFGNLVGGLFMASVLVYLLMVPLFRSYLGPFIIMFTVPLGLIGVFAM